MEITAAPPPPNDANDSLRLTSPPSSSSSAAGSSNRDSIGKEESNGASSVSAAAARYGDDEEDGDVCRICRNPGDEENPLRYPCACSGSIKFVHQDYLLQWLNHSNALQCEIFSDRLNRPCPA